MRLVVVVLATNPVARVGTDMKIGRRTMDQLARLNQTWNQGDHVLITGGTGSGKTLLARRLVQLRLDRGGSVVVFMAKLQPDDTITDYYKGFVRWKTWKKRPNITDTKILFWPDVEGKSAAEAKEIFKREYAHALNEISRVGKWTVVIDEGLYTTSPTGLNFGAAISDMYQLIRSGKGTMITLAQRPAHLPLAIYANISNAFIGRASEPADLKRLGDLDTNISARDMQYMIRSNGKHDFLWIPVSTGALPERVNLVQ